MFVMRVGVVDWPSTRLKRVLCFGGDDERGGGIMADIKGKIILL